MYLTLVFKVRENLSLYLNSFGAALKRKFGGPVGKIQLSGGFTCPNRDGTLGRGGCTFCSPASYLGNIEGKSLENQMKQGAEGRRYKKWMAYFQAYTSTYAEIAKLKTLYDKALQYPEVCGLIVATRPDMVPDEVLDLLAHYMNSGYEVWLELGLQSAFDSTLQKLNRRHTFHDYEDAVERAHAHGLRVCTHLMIGLPEEEMIHYRTTLELVLQDGVEALKLHQLCITKGSRMASLYRDGLIKTMDFLEYADTAASLIREIPPDVLIARCAASVRKEYLISPDWAAVRWPCLNEICRNLASKGSQGSSLGKPFSCNMDNYC